MKAIIICIRLFYHKIFQEIERKIKIKAVIVWRIWQQVEDLGASNDFIKIFFVYSIKKE